MQAYNRNNPERPGLKRFKPVPKYQHLRSDGLARRDDKQGWRYSGLSSHTKRDSGHMPRLSGSFPLSHGYVEQ